MRWEGRRQSDNIEDRRGMRVSRGGLVGGGLGTIAIALLIMFMGGDPTRRAPGRRRGAGADDEGALHGIAGRGEVARADSSARSLAETEDCLERAIHGHGRRVPQAEARAVPRRGRFGLRRRRVRRWGPSIARRTRASTSTSTFFKEMEGQTPCGRRLCARLRRRARGGSPRAEPARHLEPGAGDAAASGVGEIEAQCSFPCASSCRPTALPASGATAPTRTGIIEPGDVEEAIDRGERHRRRHAADAAPAAPSCRIPSRTAASEQRTRWLRRGIQDRLRRVLRHLQGGRSLIVHKHPVPAGIRGARGRQGRGLRIAVRGIHPRP